MDELKEHWYLCTMWVRKGHSNSLLKQEYYWKAAESQTRSLGACWTPAVRPGLPLSRLPPSHVTRSWSRSRSWGMGCPDSPEYLSLLTFTHDPTEEMLYISGIDGMCERVSRLEEVPPSAAVNAGSLLAFRCFWCADYWHPVRENQLTPQTETTSCHLTTFSNKSESKWLT